MRRFFGAVAAALVLCGCGGGDGGGQPVFVVTTDADSGPGSLRDWLLGLGTSVPAGSGIAFDLDFPATIRLSSPLPTIASDVTIIGPGRGALEISGELSVRPFVVDFGATLSISSLTIIDGLAAGAPGEPGEGGGMLVVDGHVEATNVLFFQNRAVGGDGAAGSGGGLCLLSGSIVLVGSFFVDNEALGGAGGLGKGGGVFVGAGTATLIGGNTFDDNVASDDAGTLTDNDDVYGFDADVP